MKLQIDTEKKTIKVEDNVNLGDFLDVVEKMLPNWKEFELICNVTIEKWTNPIIIRPYRYWWDYDPSTVPHPYPWITYESTGDNIKLKTDDHTISSGVYNIEA